MSSIRIRVGAQLDASFEATLRTLESATTRAQRRVVAEQDKAAKAQERAQSKAIVKTEQSAKATGTALAKGVSKGAQEAERRYQQMVSEMERGGSRALTPFMRAMGQLTTETKDTFRQSMAAFDQYGRHIEAGLRRQEGAWRQQQENARKGSRVGRDYATGLGSMVGFAGKGVGVAGSLARAAGVDLSFESIAGKNADLEQQAIDLSNAAYMPGDTKSPNGIRRNPRDLVAKVRDVAGRTGTDPGEAMAGLQAFVAKTGDLESGLQALAKMSALAKATGSSLKDVMDASADIANSLGDVTQKGDKLDAVMRLVASQAKVGSIEMADWAKRMPKIAAAAGQVEGDFGTNVTKLAALGQIAKRGGGASSAAEAATSVAGLINTMKTPARIEAFSKNKIDVFGQSGRLRDPVEVILDALKKTGGDPIAMKKMFANVQGERAVTGLARVYTQAGGGQAGEAAFRAAIAEFTTELLTADEVQRALNETLKSQKSMATRFNNEMSKVVEEIQAVLLPAFAALGPAIVGATKWFADYFSETFGNKPEAMKAKYGGDIEQSKRVAGILNQGVEAGALPMSAVQQGQQELDRARATRAKLSADLQEQGGLPQQMVDASGTPKGIYGGYETDKDRQFAEVAKAQMSQLDETIETLSRSMSIIVDNIMGTEVVKVRLIADDTKEVKVPHSPLGGRQAIAAGC